MWRRTCACLSSSSSKSSLSLWHNAVKKIPYKNIIPMEIGGHRGQKFKAWYGDKVLNAAVARELMKEKHRPRHNAVIYHGSAVSNWFLSIKAKTLLPNLPNEIIAPSCWNRCCRPSTPSPDRTRQTAQAGPATALQATISTDPSAT